MASSSAAAAREAPLTPDERRKHAQLVDALSNDKAVGPAWVGLREALVVLFCAKLDVAGAQKRYTKWVDMLKSFGFASLAEVVGPTASAHLHRSGATPAKWREEADWAALCDDAAAHKFYVPAGSDSRGRRVMWELGVAFVTDGNEKKLLRVITLLWLAVHADWTTLREGLVVVHMVATGDGEKLALSSTRRLIGAATAFPARPQKVLVAGLSPVGVAIAKTLIRVIFAVTRTKLLERILFIKIPEIWQHLPHRSIPKLEGVLQSGGAFGGTTHPIDWIEWRLRHFDPLSDV